MNTKSDLFMAATLAGLLLVNTLGCHEPNNCHTSDGSGCEPDNSGGASHSSSHQGVGGAGGGDGASGPGFDYCNCMLSACHDEYHSAFGPETDEVAARENCLAVATELPSAGMDVDTGNFVECRLHYCELGKSDESVCPNTIGGVCAD